MTTSELNKLKEISLSETYKIGSLLRNYLDTVTVEEETPEEKKRTLAQNDAMHVFFTHIANALNEAGLSVQEVMAETTEFDWTLYRVKELLWKKSLKKLYGKESTTKMNKKEEVDNVYEHINRFLAKGFVKNSTGERVYIDHIPFPNDPDKGKIKLAQHNNKTKEDYPEYNGPATI